MEGVRRCCHCLKQYGWTSQLIEVGFNTETRASRVKSNGADWENLDWTIKARAENSVRRKI